MRNDNDDRFLILKHVKNFIIDLEKLLITFPKKDFYTRDAVYKDSLELLEIVYRANYEYDKVRKRKLQIDALAKINKLDFYIERAYKLGYISGKKAQNKSEQLLKINKMVYVWCNNES